MTFGRSIREKNTESENNVSMPATDFVIDVEAN
jgi:hypothetical protein